MTTRKTPAFFDLTRVEAEDLLTRNHVGRLAFSFHDRVDIEPISYVFSGDWLYARTAPGTKLAIVQHHPWVAFEVDEVRSRVDWRSVVVHGTIYFLDPDREADRRDYDAAVKVLQSADADALTSADATPK
ncbi:MAG TPA: pyridoxamine 5'-phosphate oxidase family protein, partial [Gemmatimonadaceae bacterium]